MSASYTRRNDKGMTLFNVTPARAPLWWGMLVAAVVLFYIAASQENAPTTLFVLLGLVAVWATFTDARPKDHRRASSFHVGSEGITTDRVVDANGVRLPPARAAGEAPGRRSIS